MASPSEKQRRRQLIAVAALQGLLLAMSVLFGLAVDAAWP